MCVEWTGQWKVTDRDLVAYKVVVVLGSGEYGSQYAPSFRESQEDLPKGDLLSYSLYQRTESNLPGIYLYVTPDSYLEGVSGFGFRLLKGIVPKGSIVRRGKKNFSIPSVRDNYFPTINATAFIPTEDITQQTQQQEKDLSHENSDQDPDSDHPVTPDFPARHGRKLWGHYGGSTRFCDPDPQRSDQLPGRYH